MSPTLSEMMKEMKQRKVSDRGYIYADIVERFLKINSPRPDEKSSIRKYLFEDPPKVALPIENS